MRQYYPKEAIHASRQWMVLMLSTKAVANKCDAVITDIVMPKMDGIALIKELLKRTPKLPIMVITGHDKEFSSVTAVAAGAKEFIKKPFSLTEFALRFQKMMSDCELSLQIEAKQKEMLFHIQKRAVEEITGFKKRDREPKE